MRDEMDKLRGVGTHEEQVSLDKFVQNDYFYKELSGKPKVSFVVPDASGDKNTSDPIDAFMDRRPDRSALGAA